jgi:hypothetical protein
MWRASAREAAPSFRYRARVWLFTVLRETKSWVIPRLASSRECGDSCGVDERFEHGAADPRRQTMSDPLASWHGGAAKQAVFSMKSDWASVF